MGAREEELKPEQIQKWERVQNRVRKIAEMDAGQRAMEILRGDRVWIVRLVWLLERDQQLAKEEAILSEREATADDYVGRAMEEMQQQNVDHCRRWRAELKREEAELRRQERALQRRTREELEREVQEQVAKERMLLKQAQETARAAQESEEKWRQRVREGGQRERKACEERDTARRLLREGWQERVQSAQQQTTPRPLTEPTTPGDAAAVDTWVEGGHSPGYFQGLMEPRFPGWDPVTCGHDQESWEEEQEMREKAERVDRVQKETQKEMRRQLREQQLAHKEDQRRLAELLLAPAAGSAPSPGMGPGAATGGTLLPGEWWTRLRMAPGTALQAAVCKARLWEQAEEVRWGGGMEVEGGLTMLKYKAGTRTDHFVVERNFFNLRAALDDDDCRWRLECRGLVVRREGGELKVEARPMPKMFDDKQLSCTTTVRWQDWRRAKVVEAAEKVDGALLFGVWAGTGNRRGVELWTRNGRTPLAEAARQHAVELDRTRGSGYLRLLEEVEQQGATACFEWTGRQVRVKVKYTDERLVLTTVRQKESGRMWSGREVRELATDHRVPVAGEAPELVGMSLGEARDAVREWEGREGVIVEVEGGMRVKLKSRWWRATVTWGWQGWKKRSEKEVETEREQRQRRTERVQTRGQRVVVAGLPRGICPARMLGTRDGLVRVEAVYDRDSGARGVVVCGFEEEQQAATILRDGKLHTEWGVLWVQGAHSRRTVSTKTRRVQSWQAKA